MISSLFGPKLAKLLIKLSWNYRDLLLNWKNLDKTRTEEQLHGLEQFVCNMYNQKTHSINKARLDIFNKTFKTDHTLPPNQETLVLHCKRANYQAAIWRHSLVPSITAPSPTSFGWISNLDTTLTIQWTERPLGHEANHPITVCGCLKTKCIDNHCKCRRAGETCTPLFCKCKSCSNLPDFNMSSKPTQAIETDEDTDICSNSSSDSEGMSTLSTDEDTDIYYYSSSDSECLS